ncbi:hypothetical protein SDC9_170641 [bioreactor metagenome]|uniref:Uncharacterized protein n=1 Tax=bioreactor metagenome TaxID=1076179 RepID=A0A645GHP8_9ZZZZ
MQRIFVCECKISDGDHARSRIAIGRAVCAALVELGVVNARLLHQLAFGGVLERFVHFHKPARQRPHADVGMVAALDHEQRYGPLAVLLRRKHRHIDRHGRMTVFVLVIIGQKLLKRLALFIAFLHKASVLIHRHINKIHI